MTAATSRWVPPALAVVMLAGTGLAAVTADRPQLTRDGSLVTLAPADGARVKDGFLLAWSAGAHKSMRFAVLIDHPAPRPSYGVQPGPNTLIVTGTAVRLTLGPREGGSPSARHWHEIVIVPLDANDYRVGEDAAVVHVRDSA